MDGKHLLSNAALPNICLAPCADSHQMPRPRMPTCVDAARGKTPKRPARTRPSADREARQPSESFKDRTLTWFRVGEQLEDASGMYELQVPEETATRTTRVLMAVVTGSALLIALAYVVTV